MGETGGEFRTRIHHHRSDIRTKKKTPIGSHFNGKGCEMRDMRVTFLEHFKWEPQGTLPYDPNKARRLQAERKWQNNLLTYQPFGLNTMPAPQDRTVLPLVVPYSSAALKVTNLCRQTYNQLLCDKKDTFYKPMVGAYKRNHNLKDLLTSAKISWTKTPRTRTQGTPPPPRPNSDKTQKLAKWKNNLIKNKKIY